MQWSFVKPTEPGFYWCRMKKGNGFSAQSDHVIKLALDEDDEGELIVHRYNGHDWQWDMELSIMSEQFEYAGPIPAPEPQ